MSLKRFLVPASSLPQAEFDTPPLKKQKALDTVKTPNAARPFQVGWLREHSWLVSDPAEGMKCKICWKWRHVKEVMGPDQCRNSMATPTTEYRHAKVARHSDTRGHLEAVKLETGQDMPVFDQDIAIAVPALVVPAVKALFRSAVYLVRTGTSFKAMPHLNLQVSNGLKYDIRYKDPSYCSDVLHYIADVVRTKVKQLWVNSSFRCVMADEIKTAGVERLMLACRVFSEVD